MPSVKPLWPHERRQSKGSKPKARNTRSQQNQSATSFIPQHGLCLFLNLPRELRDEIYSFALPSYATLTFGAPEWSHSSAGRFYNVQHDMSQYSLTILALCKQIRAEASALFYGSNHFEFSVGIGYGPSPYNTIRTLPQCGISQITACTIHLCICLWITAQHVTPIRNWMAEMCELLKHGGNLREITIEVEFDYTTPAGRSELLKIKNMLKPLERLNGIKMAIVKGIVAEDYKAELERKMKDDGIRTYKKRKIGTDSEDEVVLRPKKKFNAQY